ncbi:hypothetical protein [Nakamurella lactea]|uniref:hypothetical protein n=1 Tax=Nakamurella lactea TaxID=459515 RepID=UPI00041DA032|nr:hypothetical protein [Nakamurella lactea]
MIDPTAMIMARSAQRRHLDAARLDGPVEPARREPQRRVRRSLSALLIRAGRGLEPSPRSAGQGQPLRSVGA